MKFKLISLFALLFVCTCFYAFRSSDDPFEELLKRLAVYNEEHAQEKVYLHLDKPYYAIGDDIWFKAYVTETYTGKPSQISTTLYVELIKEDSVKQQLKLLLSSGITWGDFKLSDSLPAGNYRIRAYTQWMRNAGPDYFYDKTIMIGSTAAETDKMRKATQRAANNTKLATIALQLFPEGGSLVENLPSRIGVKAINGRGLGEEVAGTVFDNTGNEIVEFNSTTLGMGSLLLTPQPGKKYVAKIKLKDGTTQETALPSAMPSGYVLAINNADSSRVTAKVYISKELLSPGEMKLIVQHNNIVYKILRTTTEKQVTVFSIPKKGMPAGILHFTLFNPSNLPVAERLVFIDHTEMMIDSRVNHLKPKYSKREKTEVEISARDMMQPTSGSFSVTVTHTDAVKPDNDTESNILTSLLLTSDLKGYIEKPNYYLQDGKLRVSELDNLMLTQGWSRFVWKDIMETPARAVEFMPERTQAISGTVTTNGKKPVVNGKVSLVSTSNGFFKIDTLTDASGHFAFNDLAFSDSTTFLVQASTPKDGKYVQVKLDNPAEQQVTKNKNQGDIVVHVNDELRNYIEKSQGYFAAKTKLAMLNGTLQLKEVAIVQKKKKVIQSANINGPGIADQVITGKDLNAGISLGWSLANRIAGVTYRNDNFYITRKIVGARLPPPMGILYNGIFVDITFLQTIVPQDVITVEVLKSDGMIFSYGTWGEGGVLVITANMGSSSVRGERGMLTYSPKGYNMVREFYSPQYTPENKNTDVDNRTTVYWNPNVITSASGTGKFSYYNTDQPGTYRMVIEGINDNGHLARAVLTYDVQ
jgi:hypothetical protein